MRTAMRRHRAASRPVQSRLRTTDGSVDTRRVRRSRSWRRGGRQPDIGRAKTRPGIVGDARLRAASRRRGTAGHDDITDRSRRAARDIATVTGIVDGWRALGMKAMITIYDGVLARLLLAAGQPADAQERVDIGLRLAEKTGMHFYDAELLRIRAHTHDDFHQRRDGLRAAIELARRQHANIFELRTAADDFALRGEEARQGLRDSILRFPDRSTWPELSRARASLG